MSYLLREQVLVMPAMSKAKILDIAERFLSQHAPDVLREPRPLDIAHLVDQLERAPYRIHVQPAQAKDLPDCHAATDPAGTPGTPIDILVRETAYDRLFSGGPMARHPRSTIAHELGHAVLHVPQVRQQRGATGVFRRAERREIKPYHDPEWQAWTFAGCILAPPHTLRMLKETPLDEIAELYEISISMLQAHLRRFESCIRRKDR